MRVALTEDGVPMSTLREIALLKQLDAFKHPNIVKFVDFIILSTNHSHVTHSYLQVYLMFSSGY